MDKLRATRVVAIGAALVLAVGACGSTPAASDTAPSQSSTAASQAPSEPAASAEPVTITFWTTQPFTEENQKALTDAVTAYNDSHPGTTVEMTYVSNTEYNTKLQTAFSGGTAPDVILLNQTITRQYAAAGLINPIDDLVAASDVKPEDYFPGAWDSTQYDGKTWGLPRSFDVWEQLYYNVDAFNEAGITTPPKTWDEWLDAAKKLTSAPDKYGITLMGVKDGGTIPAWLSSLIYTGGGAILSNHADGSPVIDSPENVETMQLVQELVKYAPEGVTATDFATAVGYFTSGKAAMMLNGSWQQGQVTTDAKFKWAIAVPPAPEGKSFVGATGGFNVGMNAKTEHPDQAFDFMKYWSTTAVANSGEENTFAYKTAAEAALQANKVQPDVIIETLSNTHPFPLIPETPQVFSIVEDMFQGIALGGDVATGLKDAQSQLEAIPLP